MMFKRFATVLIMVVTLSQAASAQVPAEARTGAVTFSDNLGLVPIGTEIMVTLADYPGMSGDKMCLWIANPGGTLIYVGCVTGTIFNTGTGQSFRGNHGAQCGFPDNHVGSGKMGFDLFGYPMWVEFSVNPS